MENVTANQVILGISIILAFGVTLVYVFLQHRDKANLTAALTEAVKGFSANTKALDLLEPLATKVVPASLVLQANKGADFVKTLTPDDLDQLIDALRDLLNKTTDGKPNAPDPAFVASIPIENEEVG